MNWSNPVAGPLHVEAGAEVKVLVTLEMPAGAWGTLDDFSLSLATPAADMTELLALVALYAALAWAAVVQLRVVRRLASVQDGDFAVALGGAGRVADRGYPRLPGRGRVLGDCG